VPAPRLAGFPTAAPVAGLASWTRPEASPARWIVPCGRSRGSSKRGESARGPLTLWASPSLRPRANATACPRRQARSRSAGTLPSPASDPVSWSRRLFGRLTESVPEAAARRHRQHARAQGAQPSFEGGRVRRAVRIRAEDW